ncbi:hypothetical protein POV27_15200 [Aureisphaera galaxeae]|uniref:hypothetical protein n=1 Tax=Aureisphaera galaxeae TaxID=1538023 RepID=UPI002350883E|nr:hypothetical protein [Aureisphaera galaxeae]MDC8005409.1 hypothetical protein [Aureisphaera galaxeae]
MVFNFYPKGTGEIGTGAFTLDVRINTETPLHRSVAYANEQTITFLIEHAADKEANDPSRNTSYG